jgi:UPF0755 protein
MATRSTSVKVKMKMTNFMLRTVLNFTFYVLLVVLIIYIGKLAYTTSYQLYGPVTVDKAPGRNIVFEIKQGESTMDIAGKLQQKRVILNKYSFYLKTKIESVNIMPGTYELNSSMTYDEVLEIITDYSASIVNQEDSEGKKKTDSNKKSETKGTNDKEAKD